MTKRRADTSRPHRIIIADDKPRAEEAMNALGDSSEDFHLHAVTSLDEFESSIREGGWDACLINEASENCSVVDVDIVLSKLDADIPKVLFRVEDENVVPFRVMLPWSRELFPSSDSNSRVEKFGRRLETLIYDHYAGDIAGFKKFLSHLSGVACIKEVEGQILYVNKYAELWFDRPVSEIIGKTDRELWPDEKAEEIITEDKRAIKPGELRERIEVVNVHGEDRTYLTLRFPLNDKSRNILGILSLDITKRTVVERKLMEAASELQERNRQLERKSIALREVLAEAEYQRDQVKRNIAENLDIAIFPIVDRLKMMADAAMQPIIEELKIELTQVSSPFLNNIKNEFSDLSPRELEVCRMIRRGMSSKEIADNLSLSVATIHKYRELIRKKLGLVNNSESLKQYLQNRETVE